MDRPLPAPPRRASGARGGVGATSWRPDVRTRPSGAAAARRPVAVVNSVQSDFRPRSVAFAALPTANPTARFPRRSRSGCVRALHHAARPDDAGWCWWARRRRSIGSNARPKSTPMERETSWTFTILSSRPGARCCRPAAGSWPARRCSAPPAPPISHRLAPGRQDPPVRPVFIGITVPRTGTYAVQGEDELKGYQLAVEHINSGDPLIKTDFSENDQGRARQGSQIRGCRFRGQAEHGGAGAIALHQREQGHLDDRFDLERGGGGAQQIRRSARRCSMFAASPAPTTPPARIACATASASASTARPPRRRSAQCC